MVDLVAGFFVFVFLTRPIATLTPHIPLMIDNCLIVCYNSIGLSVTDVIIECWLQVIIAFIWSTTFFARTK